MLHRRRANELNWLICPSTTCDHVQYCKDEVTHNKIKNKQHCVNNSFPWIYSGVKKHRLVWFGLLLVALHTILQLDRLTGWQDKIFIRRSRTECGPVS